jgi:hypothetical protein
VFSFSAHPATISVTQGIQDAFGFLVASWRRWLPIVLLISVFTLVIYAVVYSYIGSTDFRSLYYVDSYTGKIVWEPDAQSRLWSLVPPLVGLGLVEVVLNLVATWVFTATAIGGLRGRPMTVSYVVGRGLRVLAAGFLLGLAAIVALFLLLVIAVATMGIGFLLWFAAIPAAIYISMRLAFMSLAIFDGFGVIDGMKESWRLSERSVLRIFGWSLMAGLIGLAFGLIAGIVSAPFSTSGAQSISQAVSSCVSATASCLGVFMMAVLYESQRARMDPNLYGPVPMPMYGGYGYPTQPGAIPGWVNPNASTANYGYPVQPPAGSGWTSPSAPPPGYGWWNTTPQPPAFTYPGQTQPGSGWVVPGAPPSAPAYPSAPQGWVAPPAPGPLAPPQSGPAQPSAPEPPAPSDLPTPTDPPAAS